MPSKNSTREPDTDSLPDGWVLTTTLGDLSSQTPVIRMALLTRTRMNRSESRTRTIEIPLDLSAQTNIGRSVWTSKSSYSLQSMEARNMTAKGLQGEHCYSRHFQG